MDKEILSITRNEGAIAVHVAIDGEEDQFSVAIAFFNLIERIPDIGAMIGFLLAKKDDEHFQKILADSSFEIPDFNELLK